MTYSKIVSRFALSALLSLSVGMSLHAQADVAPVVPTAPAVPTITFTLPDEVTIHKTQFCVPVRIDLADPAGVTSATLVGGSCAATGQFPSAPKTAAMCVTFYSSYFPVGDYPFKAQVTDVNGVQATHNIMIHLVP